MENTTVLSYYLKDKTIFVPLKKQIMKKNLTKYIKEKN